MSCRWILPGSALRRRPTPLALALCSGDPPTLLTLGAHHPCRALPSAKRGKGMLQVQTAPTTWALLGIEANLLTDVSQSRDGVRTRGHSLGRWPLALDCEWAKPFNVFTWILEPPARYLQALSGTERRLKTCWQSFYYLKSSGGDCWVPKARHKQT